MRVWQSEIFYTEKKIKTWHVNGFVEKRYATFEKDS